MRLLSKFEDNRDFVYFGNPPSRILKAASGAKRKLSKLVNSNPGVKKVKDSVVSTVQGITGLGVPADQQAVREMIEGAQNYRNGWMGKAMAIGTLGMGAATLPMAAGMITPDATTRAVKAMREEDKIREAMGLVPLSQTPALLAEKVSEATGKAKAAESIAPPTTSVSYSYDNTRIVNMAPRRILPGELPPNSLR